MFDAMRRPKTNINLVLLSMSLYTKSFVGVVFDLPRAGYPLYPNEHLFISLNDHFQCHLL